LSLLQQYNAAFDRIQQRHRKRRAIKLERKHLQDRAAKARTELYAMTDRAARGDDNLSLSSRFSSIEGTLGDVEDGLTPGGVQWTELFETTIELFTDLGSVVSQYSAAITPVTNGLKRLLVIYKATAHVRAQTDEVVSVNQTWAEVQK
jgi:hypothetical protein